MKRAILICGFVSAVAATYAQSSGEGYLTGSFETNTVRYTDDSHTGAKAPDGKWGSNNYLKADYYGSLFSAGLQVEAYAPALLGYPTELQNTKITNYYLGWTDDNLSLTAGTFYEQFGSGLLFRSWEDRALGLNNAVVGFRVAYNLCGLINLKALWGKPRMGDMGITYNGKSNTTDEPTQIKGFDLSVSVSELLGWDDASLSIEGSLLNKYEKALDSDATLKAEGGSATTKGRSVRVNFEQNGFSLKGELVDGGNKNIELLLFKGSDVKQSWHQGKANAQLIELGYSGNGLGVNITGRRLEWMKSDIVFGNSSTSNIMNYVPAMCTQYTYLLTNIHPYTPQVGYAYKTTVGGEDYFHALTGEVGGQIDVYYNFRRGSAVGGKRGMKVHGNFATYYALEDGEKGNLAYRDFSVDVEKQFTKNLKLNLLYSNQEYQPDYGARKRTYVSNIVVADMQYKFTSSMSARVELQYLTSKEDKKDWMAVLAEANFAPHWSIYASDMYNNGNPTESQRIHYYNVGASYTNSRTRIALSYGRNRDGYVCSGGVCRMIEAYTGANIAITTSF